MIRSTRTWPILLAQMATFVFMLTTTVALPAMAQEVSGLEINSPFAGTTESLDGDAVGNYLITTSSARALTIWTKTGAQSWSPTVIRAPRRDEYASAAYLGAITPDAKYVAFSVPPLSNGKGSYQPGTARIYILDRADQHLITTLSVGIPARITRMRFSPDGQYLGAILGNGCGYRIWSREQWGNSAEQPTPKWSDDRGYADDTGSNKCCADPSSTNCGSLPSGQDIVFTGNADPESPWLLTLSDNGFRTYAKTANNTLVASGYIPRSSLPLKQPSSIALSGDASRVAIGDNWAPDLAILRRSGRTFAFERSLSFAEERLSSIGKDRKEHGKIYFPNPVWVEKDGKAFVYAFGYFQPCNLAGRNPDDETNAIVAFDYESGNASLINLHDDIDASLDVLHRHQGQADNIFFVSTRQLSVLDVRADAAAAPVRSIAIRRSLDLRGSLPDFGIQLNKEAKKFHLSSITGEDKYLSFTFDYGLMTVFEDKEFRSAAAFAKDIEGYGASQNYYNPAADDQKWYFERRIVGDPAPMFFGHPFSIENIDRNEISYSGATVADRNIAIWGTDRALRVIDSNAKIACTRPIESSAWRMNITADGHMAIVAHGDGVVRWYRLETGEDHCLPLVASLYFSENADGSWAFLAWLPNGKFMTGGGAGNKSLACYPVARADGLTSCIDFQQTNFLYDRDAVIRALSEASSTEHLPIDPNLAQSIAKAQASPTISFTLKGDTDTANPSYRLKITVNSWREGKRYLTFSAGANTAVDVPFRRNGADYNAAKPLELSTPGDYDVELTIPDTLRHKAVTIKICPLIYAAVQPDGQPSAQSIQGRAEGTYCLNVSWEGQESAKPHKRMLWALLVGFSGSSNVSALPLKFAHDDVLNFARFLYLESQRGLPGETANVPPQLFFDEMRVRLLIAGPGVSDSAGIDANPKVQQLRDDMAEPKFEIVYNRNSEPYNTLVLNSLQTIVDDIGRFSKNHLNDSVNWEHQILFYFSGHGFSKRHDNPRENAYMEFGLVTPGTGPNVSQGSMNLNDVLSKLLASPNLSIVIIDACRAEVGAAQSLDSEPAYVSTYANIGSNLQNRLHIFYSSTVGHYSYEDSEHAITDFVPQLVLWKPPVDPKKSPIDSKGGGLFSLGLIASLACKDALDSDMIFTLESSKYFFKRYFYTAKNTRWPEIEQRLKAQLADAHLPYIAPETAYDPFGSGAAILREGTPAVPQCFP